jgi:hypothetical protein
MIKNIKFMDLAQDPTPTGQGSPNPKPASTTKQENTFADFVNSTPISTSDYDTKSMLSPQERDDVIANLIAATKVESNSLNYNKIKATVCFMLQSGATSKKFEENKIFNQYGIPITSKMLKAALNKVGTSLTPRKLARTLRQDIITVAQANNIPGNLSKKFILETEEHSAEDLIWASDFQSFTEMDNMPENVKKWLQKNYNDRFNKKA